MLYPNLCYKRCVIKRMHSIFTFEWIITYLRGHRSIFQISLFLCTVNLSFVVAISADRGEMPNQEISYLRLKYQGTHLQAQSEA